MSGIRISSRQDNAGHIRNNLDIFANTGLYLFYHFRKTVMEPEQTLVFTPRRVFVLVFEEKMTFSASAHLVLPPDPMIGPSWSAPQHQQSVSGTGGVTAKPYQRKAKLGSRLKN